jgi:hypothetical protein
MAAVFRGPPVLSAVAVASLLLSSFSPTPTVQVATPRVRLQSRAGTRVVQLYSSICVHVHVVEAAKIMARTRRGARRN